MSKKVKKSKEEPKELSRLEEVLSTFNNLSGNAGNIVLLDDDAFIEDIPVIPSGILTLDYLLGVAGYPHGRIIELYGAESSGKTTICLHAMASCQQNGGIGAFIDAEHALDVRYANNLGVNTGKLLISQPNSGEEALNAVEQLAKLLGHGDLIVIDSVAALTPQAELDGEMGDSVTFDTPVYVRDTSNKYIDITTISDLHRAPKLMKGHNRVWYRKFKSLEILTHKGWAPLLGVVMKRNIKNKPIVCTRTSTGYVQTTEDHSLFMEGHAKSTKELEVFDRLDVYEDLEEINSKTFFNEELAWLMGFFAAEGSTPRTHNCNRFEICNTEGDLVEKCKTIVDKYFTCKSEIRIQTQPEHSNRKDLHVLTCTTNDLLGQLMRSCVLDKTRLKKVPIEVLNGSLTTKQAFLDGFWEGDGSIKGKNKETKLYHNNSLPLIAGIQYLNKCLGIRTNTVVKPIKPEQVTLSENKGRITRKENEIVQFYRGDAPEFLWDVSTESGTFVNAIGNIICHNSHMGLHARLMSQALRKITAIVAKTGVTVIFVNQTRMKIGVMFGSPITTTGGNALKFYATQRLEIKRGKVIKKGEDPIGCSIMVKIAKNKVAPPFREGRLEMRFGQGIPKALECLILGTEHGFIEKNGNHYHFNGQALGNGIENAYQTLLNSPEAVEYIDKELRKRLFQKA